MRTNPQFIGCGLCLFNTICTGPQRAQKFLASLLFKQRPVPFSQTESIAENDASCDKKLPPGITRGSRDSESDLTGFPQYFHLCFSRTNDVLFDRSD
jgi:hypothetical protein